MEIVLHTSRPIKVIEDLQIEMYAVQYPPKGFGQARLWKVAGAPVAGATGEAAVASTDYPPMTPPARSWRSVSSGGFGGGDEEGDDRRGRRCCCCPSGNS